MKSVFKTCILLLFSILAFNSNAYVIRNKSDVPIKIEILESGQLWAMHRITLAPNETYSHDLSSANDKWLFYRLTDDVNENMEVARRRWTGVDIPSDVVITAYRDANDVLSVQTK